MKAHRNHKKNLIVSYKNLSDEMKEMFKERYPEGYNDYLQRFEKPNGEVIFVVPMETEDTVYMVKFDVKTNVENFSDNAALKKITVKVEWKVGEENFQIESEKIIREKILQP